MINESKLNNRMLHLMESGFFGKQILSEGALSLSEDMKVRIFQSIYNWWGNQDKWILVDGIPGKNTANAIKNTTMSKFDRQNLDTYIGVALYNSQRSTSEIAENYRNLNDIHNVRALQVILCLSGRTEVKPDGVIGPVTKAAMRDKLGYDDITKVTDEKLKAVIDEAISNVEATDMSFEIAGVQGVNTSSEKTNTSSEKTNTSSEKPNTSSEKTSSGKTGSKGGYDAIFVAGITTGEGIDSQIKYFKNGFGKDANVAAFFLNGTPYGHKQTIAQVLADNPKIPAFLFSAGAGQVYNIASNGNADVNKIFVIEPYYAQGQTVKPKIDAAVSAGVPANHIYVGAYAAVGLGVVADATPTKSGNHFLAVTEVARKHSMA